MEHTAMVFANRSHAGRELAGLVGELAPQRPLVYALARGGVPVGAEIARALGAPLEVLVVRKLGARRNRELAVGALAEGGSAVLDVAAARRTGMSGEQLDAAIDRERLELERQVRRFRDGWRPADVRGRVVIVVDDGLATGLTDLAAVRATRARGAGRIVVAVPVGSAEAVEMLEAEADAVVCHTIPHELRGVGRWYGDFSPVSDEEVLAVLASCGTRIPTAECDT